MKKIKTANNRLCPHALGFSYSDDSVQYSIPTQEDNADHVEVPEDDPLDVLKIHWTNNNKV